RGQDEQIDLVDAAVVGDELEQCPGQVQRRIRQPWPDEGKRLVLPGEGRRVEGQPVGLIHGGRILAAYRLTVQSPAGVRNLRSREAKVGLTARALSNTLTTRVHSICEHCLSLPEVHDA